jgi:parallel beta-helix repeat protein
MKPSVIVLLLTILLIPLIALSTGTVAAASKTITVPTDYPTIEAAIGNASIGDTVFVKSGIYHVSGYDALTLDKPLSLIGEDRKNTIIEAASYRYGHAVIHISADNVTISGFTINGNGLTCIQIEDSYQHVPIGCRITDNNIINGSWGIITYGSTSTITGDIKTMPSYLTISGNSITDNSIDALYIATTRTTVSNNNLSNNARCGIMVDSARYVTITGNTISGNGGSSEEPFEGGISMGWWGPFDVYGNNITNNKGVGISFKEFCNNCSVAANIIAYNDVGITTFKVEDAGKGNVIYQNNIVGNTQQVALGVLMYPSVPYSEVDAIALDNGSIGNYWSDYSGSGVYSVDGNTVDHYPQTQMVDTSSVQIPEYSNAALVTAVLFVPTAGVAFVVYCRKIKQKPA